VCDGCAYARERKTERDRERKREMENVVRIWGGCD